VKYEKTAKTAIAVTIAFTCVALVPQQANAVNLKTVVFNGYRPMDGDYFENVVFTYDDDVTLSLPQANPYGSLCGSDPTSPTFGNNYCYVNNTVDRGLQSGQPSFTGKTILNVTGKYYEKIAEGGYDVYDIMQIASIGSFEGGVGPAIPHYVTDNLIDPVKVAQAAQGGGFSSGGVVLLTSNPDYSYHLFTNVSSGGYAGCGSGTCKDVIATPAPLPILGATAVLGYIGRLRTAASRLKTSHRGQNISMS
jgi:hypothetical protein